MAFLCGVIEGFYGTPWKNSERKDLFARLKEVGLNTYMYAPKDDKKHRKLWRNSYTEQESSILKNLIDTSKCHDIDFIYAISPGLDIVFTSSTDIKLLKEKLQQVHSFGCRSFAILFDDIDPELCLVDKIEYSSSADAQTAITNQLFEWFSDLNTILFCPTEYCDTRAVPNITSSEYLRTLGEKLHKNVNVFWTGPKVVSNIITVKSLENLNKVLQRKVVIWDNIHANDYDSRRMFLGPFKGRDLELYNHTSGVLTNPNCDYHSNFIPIDSLAIWKKKAVAYCGKSETDDRNNEKYDPDDTLLKLCEKWMTLFQQEQSFSLFHTSKKTNDLKLNSLVDEDSDQNGAKCNIIISSNDSDSCDDSDSSDDSDGSDNDEEDGDKKKTKKKKKPFGVEDLVLLCHFFYLPYEDGEKAREIISQFKWLKENAIDYKRCPVQQKIDRWYTKQIQFFKLCDEVSSMYESFTRVRNKRIVQQFHPYVTDLNGTVKLLNNFAKFLGSKERQDGNSFVPEDPEAWYFRGGILGEMERLLPSSNEEFEKNRSDSSSSTQIIRPYLPQDKVGVSNLFKEVPAMSMLPKEHSDLPVDSFIGAFLEDPSCQSFVFEIDDVICAIVVCCSDAENFYEKYEKEYLAKMRSKYNLTSSSNASSVSSKLIKQLYEPAFVPNANVMKKYPAVLTIEFTPKSVGFIPRLLQCVLSYVRSNVHMVKHGLKKRRVEQYKELGFDVLLSASINDTHVLGYTV